MEYTNIIYKSLFNFHNYNELENNEERLLQVIYKNKNSLAISIDNYIYKNTSHNSLINTLFKDKYLKKLIKNHTIYNEMLNLIEKKNKEINDLKRIIDLYKNKENT
jgi:hypothetical protein